MIKHRLISSFIALLLCCAINMAAQTGPGCPQINPVATPASVCLGQCSNLTAAVQANQATTSYSVQAIPYAPYPYTGGTGVSVGTDDVWSPIVNLGFNFCFFGNTYNRVVLGSNGVLTFDLGRASLGSGYIISNALPSTGNSSCPANSIAACFRDIDPSEGGNVRYYITGASPCRALVFYFDNVPLFQNGTCTNTADSKFQLVLYENTNYIDVYVENSTTCSWNNGRGIIGIQNAAASVAVCPPARNMGAWTANNEAWRFVPTGAPSYTVTWTSPAGVIGTGLGPINVCPTTNTTYTATMRISNCDGAITTYSNTTSVSINPTPTAVAGPATTLPCGGGNTSLTASGGGTYNWGGPGIVSGGNTANPTVNLAGVYTVSVSALGCTSTATTQVSNPVTPTVTAVKTDVICGTPGSATVSIAGATAPYTYTWSPSGGNAVTASGLAAGTYSVRVRDANGCIGSTTLSIANTGTASAVFTSSANQCLNTNAFTFTSTGTTGGTHTYNFSPAAGAPAAGSTANYGPVSFTSPGTYTVTHTVNAGGVCVDTKTMTVIVFPNPTAAATASINARCGLANGSFTVAGSGGTPAYNYSFNGGAFSTTTSTTNIPAGTYNVTVRDANNCTYTTSIAIANTPGPTVLTLSSNNASCGVSNGSINTPTVTGGTPTYSFSVNGGAFSTSPGLTGLASGSYSITVRDANGCTLGNTVAVGNNTGPTDIVLSSNPTICSGSTGSYTIGAVTGGTAAFDYSVNPGGAGYTGTMVYTNQPAGTYTVTVRDANNCTFAKTIVVGVIPGPSAMTIATTNANCGFNNGTATVTAVTGGVAAYQYQLDGGAFGASAAYTGLTPGTHTMTVKDANGCIYTNTLNIGIFVTPVINVIAPSNVTCNGGSNGSFTITTTGGSGGFTYTLTPGGASNATGIFTGLTAQSYTVIARDNTGCSSTPLNVTLNQPPAVSLTATPQNVSCNAGSNGSITVSGSGGTSPYQFSLNGGTFQTGTSFTGLTAGVYNMTVRDNNGCVTSQTVNVGQPTPLNLAVTSGSANCTASNGTATAVAGGGTPAYTYTWTGGGGGNATTNGLPAGSYTVTATDSKGCQITSVATIGVTSGGTATISTISNVSCFGANNGSLTVSMAGNASAPFTYNWLPLGGTGQSATNLAPGVYTVTVTDAFNCTSSASAVITEPAILRTTLTATNVSCFGGSNGTVSAAVLGGIPPYNYIWSPTASTNSTVPNVAAGTYTCIVTDANNCVVTNTVAVLQAPQIAMSSSVTSANCNQADGAASISVSGGTPAYTYTWSTGSSAPSITNVVAGTYSIQIRDAAGCLSSQAVIIPNLAGPTMTLVSQTNVSCFGGNNGAATYTVSGGVGPYFYQWSNNQLTPTATNLSAGLYTVSATDQNGCVTSASLTITQPPVLSVLVSGTDPKCYNSATGSATVGVTGGTPAYTYSWTPASAGTGTTVAGLSAGNYIVSVTDAHLCVSMATLALVNPAPLAVTITNTATSCFNSCNGIAFASPANNAGTVTYSWTGSNPQTTQTASGLCAGTYSVFISDQNGCQASGYTTITQPTALTASVTSSGNVACFNGTTGYAAVTAGGGTPAYSYTWTGTGGNTSAANNLAAGVYTVNVSDSKGCLASANITITQPTQLTAVATGTNVKCYNACDGIAVVNYNGGTGPYTFLWTPSLSTTFNAINLCNGTHSVEVTDANGCKAYSSVVLTQPMQLSAATTATSSNCGQSNGNACAQVSGGTAPLSYLWSNGVTTACDFNVVAGAYTVTVTDVNGCSVQTIANINDIAAPTVAITATTSVKCYGTNNGTAVANINGGATPYISILWSGGQSGPNPTNLTAGYQAITVTDAAGCVSSASVQITQPSQLLSVIANPVNVVCNAQCNGSATTLASGGTPPYQYNWTGGQTSANAVGLCAGVVTCTVTDFNLCASTQSFVITEPAPLVIATSSVTDVACNGLSNGNITTNVTGGTPGYSYTWTPASAGNSSSTGNLSIGAYAVTIRDTKGCTTSGNFVVNEPAPLSNQVIAGFSTCSQSNASVSIANMSGGTQPYYYYWSTSPVGTTPVITGIPAGTYTCVITDAHGCAKTETMVVGDAPSPVIDSVRVIPPTCFGYQNGQVEVFFRKGTPSFLFNWSNPIGTVPTSTVNGVGAGVYALSLTDLYGCSSTTVVNIPQPNLLTVTTVTDQTICYGQTAQIYAAAGGGSPAYTYTWNPATLSGTGPFTMNPTTTTTYTVRVGDTHGCTTSPKVITLNVKPQLIAQGFSTTACDRDSVALSPTLTSPGAGAPYTYVWNTGATTSGIKVKANGAASPMNYTVTIKDGCTIPDGQATFTINVNPRPVGSFTANILSGCAPLKVNFTANSTVASDTYDWTYGDGQTGSGSPSLHTYSDSGRYSVTLHITNAFGCSSDTGRTNYIRVYPQPVASFIASPNPTSILDPNVHFTNTSQGAGGYLWDFGDPSSGGMNTTAFQDPMHSYNYTGTYYVHLVAFSPNGCRDTTMLPVTITPDFALYIPNAFTADGNGRNDIFQPVGVGINEDNYRLDIFDRWGEDIFTSNNFRKGWDGTAKGGKIAKQDVYVYKIVVFDNQGNKHNFTGHVTLLRENN